MVRADLASHLRSIALQCCSSAELTVPLCCRLRLHAGASSACLMAGLKPCPFPSMLFRVCQSLCTCLVNGQYLWCCLAELLRALQGSDAANSLWHSLFK